MSEHCVSPCPSGFTFSHTVEWCGRKTEVQTETGKRLIEANLHDWDDVPIPEEWKRKAVRAIEAEMEDRCAERGHLTSRDLGKMRTEARRAAIVHFAQAYRKMRGYPEAGPTSADEVLKLLALELMVDPDTGQDLNDPQFAAALRLAELDIGGIVTIKSGYSPNDITDYLLYGKRPGGEA